MYGRNAPISLVSGDIRCERFELRRRGKITIGLINDDNSVCSAPETSQFFLISSSEANITARDFAGRFFLSLSSLTALSFAASQAR